MNQRTRVLSLLLAASLVFLLWTRGGSLLDSGASLGGGGRSRARRAIVGAELTELRIAVLGRKTGSYKPGRDLFRFGQPKQRQAPAPKPTPPPPAPRPQVQTPPATSPEPPARRPPRFDMTYLGSFGPADRKIAVFTDNETIHNAMVGEIIKGVFKLVNIGFESVDIGFVEFPEAEVQRFAVGGSR